MYAANSNDKLKGVFFATFHNESLNMLSVAQHCSKSVQKQRREGTGYKIGHSANIHHKALLLI